MAKNTLGEMPEGVLARKERSIKTIQIVVGVIFAVLLFIWVVSGYWRSNPAGFVITIVMGAAIQIAFFPMRSILAAELRKRGARK